MEKLVAKTCLRPGQKGTKRLMDRYGDRLICVRYRYDEESGKRYKTVELIIEEDDWTPPAPETNKRVCNGIKPDATFGVKVEYEETELREQVKVAGGVWRPRQKLWELRYQDIIALGLESRMINHDDSVS